VKGMFREREEDGATRGRGRGRDGGVTREKEPAGG